ncbi:hypothetical protein, partial [Klebsiella pneumoniae]|uniref:hypothetical protein n=1 Tax=Klebsiella pneumoniae TaxID=573 RepID=UPI001EE7875B
MPRNRPIRITRNDKKEFSRLAKNAKAKIRRTLKNYGIDLTGDVFIPESIESFGTRKGFNKWKESVSSFTNPANLH